MRYSIENTFELLRYQSRELWLGLTRIVFAVSIIPITFATFVALALAHVPQLHELYLSIIEGLSASQGPVSGSPGLHALFVLAAMFLLSGAIYFANASLSRSSAEQIFHEHQLAVVDRRLGARVAAIGCFAAGLPWIGMAYGIDVAASNGIMHIERIGYHAGARIGALQGATRHFGGGLELDLAIRTTMHELYGNLTWVQGYVRRARPVWPLLLIWLGATFWLGLVLRLPGQLARLVVRRPHVWPRTWVHPLLAVGEALGPIQDFVRRRMIAVWSGLRDLSVFTATLLLIGSLLVPLVIETYGLWVPVPANASATNAKVGWLGNWSPSWAAWHLGTGSLPVLSRIERPIGLWALASVAVAVATYVFVRKARYLSRSYDLHPGLRFLIRAARFALLASLVACILSGFVEFTWVDIARAFGPLAMTVTLCVVILKLIEVLGLVSRQTGLPAVAVFVAVGAIVVLNKLEWGTWIAVVAVIFAALSVVFALAQSSITASVLACLALMSTVGAVKYAHTISVWGWVPWAQPEQIGKHSPPQPDVSIQFDAWYKARAEARRRYGDENSNAPYPVFVIAAEGGGIYAAAASSTFLARLQERCPSFAQHVFAISGVSGGAVGAAIFHGAVDVAQPGFAAEGCSGLMPNGSDRTRHESLQGKIAHVVREDHLSPLVGRFVPDVLGTYSDRAKGLQKSLEASMSQHFSNGAAGPAKPPWTEAFTKHWSIDRPAPALVLNATWASVGNRVVFSPFNLESSQVVTLNDFTALGSRNAWEKDPAQVGLTEAAVVSARFPGVVAAYEVKGKANRRWYFVDGGYVDASGALTAQEIYRSLVEWQSTPGPNTDDRGLARKLSSDQVQRAPWHVDFRLVLLTSTQSNSKEKGTEGAQPRDLVAPVEALFNVRSLLSRNAVRETISKTDRDTTEATINLHDNAQQGLPLGWKVTIVEINLDNFELALGWKISGLTHDIVSLQLGQANLCDRASEAAKSKRQAAVAPLGYVVTMDRYATRIAGSIRNPDSPLVLYRAAQAEKARRALEVAKTIRSNSCVMAAIEKLLNRGKISDRQ